MRQPPEPRPLTARQREILTYLVEFWAGHQRFPSLRSICAAFGLSVNPNAARAHLMALALKGYLTYAPGTGSPFTVPGLGGAVEEAAMRHLDDLLANGPKETARAGKSGD